MTRVDKYVLRMPEHGGYAGQPNADNQCTVTNNRADMLTVDARHHRAALNKFVRILGINVCGRQGFTVIDSDGLHFGVERLEPIQKEQTV